ncbi:MAG: TlpA family protein disulfide reductase [Acidobacteria bacterium]|nr:TlpA family protein disulfide reductase [Acidobacteriota bacterium]
MQVSLRFPLPGLSALVLACLLPAQTPNGPAKKIAELRQLPDTERGRATRELALDIRKLPASTEKLGLASNLANLATEGDVGRDTLQDVAVTLAEAIKEQPPEQVSDQLMQLARLVRYEHVRVRLNTPDFSIALMQCESDDINRARADFTLTDFQGTKWRLKELRGKVVLVNFWATWCPPCRKEMPDLEALYKKFGEQGLVVLAITDDEAAKVQSYIAQNKYTFPVLLDAGGKVKRTFRVQGIPKTFLYDRQGKLVAQAMDMRTEGQLLDMLAQAGLK